MASSTRSAADQARQMQDIMDRLTQAEAKAAEAENRAAEAKRELEELKTARQGDNVKGDALAQQLQDIQQKLATSSTPRGNSGNANNTFTSDTSTEPTKPNMGTVEKADGHWIIKMGGVPKHDWSDLETLTEEVASGQYRSLDKTKGMKREAAIGHLEPGWSLKDSFQTLQVFVINKCRDYGMEQHCYLNHPHQTTTMVNAVLNPHMFSDNLDFVKRTADTLYAKYDDFDKENERVFKNMLLKSLHPDLKTKVHGLEDQRDRALVTWIKIVRQWKILTGEQATKLKEELKNCTLNKFDRMDVRAALDFIKPRAEALYDTREWDPLLIIPFLRSLFHAYPTDSEFHLGWWTEIHNNLIKPLEDAHRKLKMELGQNGCRIEDEIKGDPNQYPNLDRKSI